MAAKKPPLFPKPAGFRPRKLSVAGAPLAVTVSIGMTPIDAELLSDRVVSEAMKAGVAEACFKLMDHAMNKAPMAPKRGGTLRESGAIFINNKLIHENSSEGGKWLASADYSVGGEGREWGSAGVPITRVGGTKARRVSGAVAFLAWYAGLVHEGIAGWHEIKKWTLPGSGRKFLSSKIDRHKDEYVQIVADRVTARLSKALRRAGMRAARTRSGASILN